MRGISKVAKCLHCGIFNLSSESEPVCRSFSRIQIRKRDLFQRRCHSTLLQSTSRVSSAPIESSDGIGSTDRDQGSRRGERKKYAPPMEKESWASKVLFNSYLQEHVPNTTFRDRIAERVNVFENKLQQRVEMTRKRLPISARFLDESLPQKETEVSTRTEGKTAEEESVLYPFKIVTKTEFTDDSSPGEKSPQSAPKYLSEADKLLKHGLSVEDLVARNMDMNEGDVNYDLDNEWMGTPISTIPRSEIPCGGCGALLHCQDTSIPGYMASEKFKIRNDSELRGELCVRCSSLRSYNSALSINVSPEDYPRILRTIKSQFAMVLLVVDLTDFPCCIWPGISEIIGTKRPVYLVGNKVDLIPRDSETYLNHIAKCLFKTVQDSDEDRMNIVHTTLISATTGYGVEELISKIYRDWGNDGNIYIMGCTNVGKSSLFNALAQSDMCKIQVVDRIQQATVSQWPGTTLNLLKFPVMADDGWRMARRNARLSADKELQKAEEKENAVLLKLTKDSKHAVLQGHIGRSFQSRERNESAKNPMIVGDVFHINPNSRVPPTISKPGQWDPSDPEIQGKWCFDTPGTVNENQILDILTLSELKKTIPTELIEPRTYFIKEGMTMFLGGLVRIDYVEGFRPIRYTVFSSKLVPVTISLTEDADYVYEQALGNPAFSIPSGSPDRLKDFPKLESSNFEVTGMGHDCSCCDIVLSATGWIAVTAGIEKRCKLTVHTPNGKGMFLRQPALLPYAVNLKGKRIRDTPAYLPHRVFVPNPKL